jgi:hypothetical protein
LTKTIAGVILKSEKQKQFSLSSKPRHFHSPLSAKGGRSIMCRRGMFYSRLLLLSLVFALLLLGASREALDARSAKIREPAPKLSVISHAHFDGNT